MEVATIKLVSTNAKAVDTVANQIKTITSSINVKCRGPVHFPTRKFKYATRRNPCSDGSHTFEKWEMRFHKRLIQIDGNEQVLRQIMRIPVPDNVQIEISLG